MQLVTDRRGWSLGALALLLALLVLGTTAPDASANVAPECQTGINSQVLRTGKPTKVHVFCSDPDGQSLTINRTNLPDHGTLGAFTYNAGMNAYEATFTPAASYMGPDDFVFTASDGQATSPTYGFDLVITENHAPRCETARAVHTKVGEPVLINVFCTDADIQDQELAYATVAGQGPDHGSLGPVTDQTVEYTPTPGYTGADRFTFRASDGNLSDTYSQTVHVADTPLCVTPPAVQIRSGGSRFLAVDCTRPEDDTGFERYQIGTAPTKGTLSPAGEIGSPERFYEAGADATGDDSYTIRMVSSSGASPYVTQVITTGPNVNHAPECDVASFPHEPVFWERPLELPISCTDLDEDPISYAAGADPEHGTSSTEDGRVFYTADVDYLGFDEVPFTASDGHGGSTAASFPVSVRQPEEPECFQGPIDRTVRPGESVDIGLFCTSPQNDPQTFEATAPAKGTLSSFDGDGNATYTADEGESGTDAFTVRAVNDAGQSEPQTVTITIDASFNRAPQCNANSVTPKRVPRNSAATLAFGAVCTDPDGDPVVVERRSNPAHGSVTAGPAETLSYTQTTDYLGADSFTYVARDDRGVESGVTTFHINVVESTAPTCSANAPITVRPHQAKSIAFNCFDADGQPITYRIVSAPRGTLSPPGDATNPVRTYTAPTTAGSDSFSYKAVTTGGESAVRTQQITVDASFNTAPGCTPNAGFPDNVVQGRAQQLPIATWCDDPDDDALTFTRTTPDPQHGTATATNGAITYTSDPGYTGLDSFGYTADDGHGGTVTETYTVNVVPPSPPTCDTPDPVDVRTGGQRTVAFGCYDENGDALDFEITDAPGLGTLDPAGDGPEQVRTYRAGSTSGDDSYSYRATSVNGTSGTATQVLHLDPSANAAPDCITNSGFPEQVPHATATALEPLCSDDDGDELGYTKISNPAHGTLSDAGGRLVYTPTSGYAGPDQFLIKASDGHGGESSQFTHHVDVATPPVPTCEPNDAITLRPNTSRPVVFDCAGDDLTYVIDTPPARGQLTGSGAARTFTAGDEEGDASFTWHAHGETAGNSAGQTQTITIDADHNVAPVCPPSMTVAADAGVEQTITPACTDGDGDEVSVAKLSDPAHGTLTDAGGVLEYTAAPGYGGTDSFTYRASDGHGGQSGTGTVTVNVTNTNRAPACTGGPFEYEVEAGDVLNLPAPPCIDPDGDTVSYEIVAAPAHGTLGDPEADGARTYTPDPGFDGEDSFTYRASDGLAESALQTATITVTPPPNDPPACSEVTRSVAPDAPATIQLGCTDPDGDPVTLEIATPPAHGTLGAVDQGTDRVVYTPDPGYTGSDAFSYRATDGSLTGPEATVSLDVTVAPECEDVARTTAVGEPVSLPLSCEDPDGDPLTLSLVVAPAHGSLGAIAGGEVTYTPDPGYAGTDTFTFAATDGTAESAPATASVTVTRAPSCDDVERTTAVGDPVSVPLSCTDPEDDDLMLEIVDDPSRGTLGAIAGGAVTYTPNAGASGEDSFSYRASDGAAASSLAEVTITITRAPGCSPVSAKTAVGEPVTLTLACADLDGDPLALEIVDGPSKGALGAISGDEVTYTPNADEHGADTFTYRASDGTAQSPPATASITITRAPGCETVDVRTQAGAAVEVPLECTDRDGDALTLSIVDPPAKGTLGSVSSSSVTYTPNVGAFGADAFTYRATDGTAASDPAAVNVTITRPPSCLDVETTATVGSSVSVPLSCTDPDGDPLELSASSPAQGSLGEISGDSVTYTPDADAVGEDSFTFTASDGTAESAPATATITLTGPPHCDAVSARTRVGTPVSVPLTCTDPDGDALTLAIEDGPTLGTLGPISGDEVSYTPNPGVHGTDTFTYLADDGSSDSEPATATIRISRAPSCEDVAVRTAVGAAVSVPLSCADEDGDSLTLAAAEGPDKGTLGSVSETAVTYTPDPGAFGSDGFTYTADDGAGESEAATVSITITRPPACEPVDAETPADTPVTVTLSCSDPDGDALTLHKVSAADHGTLGDIEDGQVTYTPDDGFAGEDAFTYRASDGEASSPPATVSVTVTPPPNQAPSCDPVTATTLVETAVEVELSCSDPDGDDLTLEIVDGPDHGTVGDVSGGTVTHTPGDDYFGADAFAYRASDGDLASSPATVTLDVQAKPEVTLASDRATAGEGDTVTFTATASDPDGEVAEYRFSADGAVVQTGTSRILARSFGDAGTHTVVVRVTDDDGRTATASRSVTITEPGVPAAGGTPPGGGATPPAGGGPAADVAAPAVSLKAARQKLKAVLAKGLALTASCSEPCTLKLQLVVDKRTAKKLKLGKKATVVGTLTRSVSGTAKLKVKLTGKAKTRLKRAKSVKLVMRAVATDAAGNAASKTATVTLKR